MSEEELQAALETFRVEDLMQQEPAKQLPDSPAADTAA